MTQNEFLAFYPQFADVFPAAVLREAVERANARFSDFGPDTEEARRLFAAHRLTMYAFTCLPEGTAVSAALLSSAGRAEGGGRVTSRRVGDVSVSCDAFDIRSARVSTALADLPETAFGLQLLTLIRLHARSRYVR